MVNTENGPQQVSKTVTVSPAAPKTQQFVLVGKAAKDNWTLDPTGKAVTELTWADRGAAKDTADARKNTTFIYALDQYGVYAQLADGTAFTAADLTKTNYKGNDFDATNKFAYDATNNRVKLVEASDKNVGYRANTPLFFNLFDGAAFATLKVTIVAEEVPTVPFTSSTGVTNVVLTASEALAYANNADLKDHFTLTVAAAGSTAEITEAKYTTADNKITFTITDDAGAAKIAAGDKISVKATLEDLVGNKTAAATVLKAADDAGTLKWAAN